MRIFSTFDDLPPGARGAVVAIGNFDGVHLGHQGVIAETRSLAAKLAAPAAVMTFEPHPRRLFVPDAPPFRLSSLDAKARDLARCGVDHLYVCPFDRAFAAMPAEDFIAQVLVHRLGVRHVVVGDDFCFGHRRQGDVSLLRKRGAAAGFGVSTASKVAGGNGRVISSNTIRKALAAGDTAAAAELLGRPWEMEGPVVHGDAWGRELGFPTANIDIADYLHPAKGIYAVRAGIVAGDGTATSWHDGAASFGLRPQFEGADIRLEVFLIDYSGDLYGKTLRVAFHGYLRGEETFSTLEGLIARIEDDVARCRVILAGLPPEA